MAVAASLPVRQLGARGPGVSALAFGNWLNHGGLVGYDAIRSVRAVGAGNHVRHRHEYAGGQAEKVRGALAGNPEWSPSAPSVLSDLAWRRRRAVPPAHSRVRGDSCGWVDHIDLYQAPIRPDVALEETLTRSPACVELRSGMSASPSGPRKAVRGAVAESMVPMVFDRVVPLLWRVPEAELVRRPLPTGWAC